MLDSSAVLAVILEELGADLVAKNLSAALISTVNVAETYGIAARRGLSADLVRGFLTYQGIGIVPLCSYDAEVAGRMMGLTAKPGLSLGDRCCLALGLSQKAQVLTADRAWLKFAEPLGLDIKAIR